MEREVVAREQAGVSLAQPSEKSVVTAFTLIAGSSPSSSTCCYCQPGHSSNKCKNVTDIEERRRILRKTGWCYVCLQRCHVSRSCRSTTKCYKCKGKHHSSICMAEIPKDPVSKDETPTGPIAPSSQTGTSSKPGLNPNARTFSSPSLLTMAN